MADETRTLTVDVTLQRLDPAQVAVTFDTMHRDRRVVSLRIGSDEVAVKLLDELETVAAVIRRADVMLQARLQMVPSETAVAT